MEEKVKKPFKYYAIRIANAVVFRRTVLQVTCVRSVLHKPGTDLLLEQRTYVGGKVIGFMPYNVWTRHGGTPFTKCLRITRDLYRSLSPYITKSE